MPAPSLENCSRRFNMSDYENPKDKLTAHLEELRRKHRALDEYLEQRFFNHNITDEVRMLKTQKLWLKDEIYRIQRQLEAIEDDVNGS